jgi:hypothetical protein
LQAQASIAKEAEGAAAFGSQARQLATDKVTKPSAPASVPEESTDSSEEEVLPFGPLRRLDSTPRLFSLPRSKSFERMTTNDRQPPPTPLSSLAKSHSSGNLFYAHVDQQPPPTPVAKSQSSLMTVVKYVGDGLRD